MLLKWNQTSMTTRELRSANWHLSHFQGSELADYARRLVWRLQKFIRRRYLNVLIKVSSHQVWGMELHGRM